MTGGKWILPGIKLLVLDVLMTCILLLSVINQGLSCFFQFVDTGTCNGPVTGGKSILTMDSSPMKNARCLTATRHCVAYLATGNDFLLRNVTYNEQLKEHWIEAEWQTFFAAQMPSSPWQRRHRIPPCRLSCSPCSFCQNLVCLWARLPTVTIQGSICAQRDTAVHLP